MREPLAIAVAQPPRVAEDVAASALAHAEWCARRDPGGLPELSLTGYELDASVITARQAGGRRVRVVATQHRTQSARTCRNRSIATASRTADW